MSLGGVLYFSAIEPTGGVELWRSDGTAAGTRMVKDIDATPAALVPQKLAGFKGALYFTTSAGALYRTDGTPGGAVRLSSVTPRRN